MQSKPFFESLSNLGLVEIRKSGKVERIGDPQSQKNSLELRISCRNWRQSDYTINSAQLAQFEAVEHTLTPTPVKILQNSWGLGRLYPPLSLVFRCNPSLTGVQVF